MSADLPNMVFNKIPFETKKQLADALQQCTVGQGHGDGQVHLVTVEPYRIAWRDPVSELVDRHTLPQVAWYLEHDRWENQLINTCTVPNCVSHLKPADVGPEEEDADLKLVEKQAVTLADLYRKGKKRGLISARSGY